MRVDLKNTLSNPKLKNIEKVLVILSSDNKSIKQVNRIKEIAVQNGLRKAIKWNISSILSKSNGKAIRVQNGWEITKNGTEYLNEKGILEDTSSPLTRLDLRRFLDDISSKSIKSFVEETIHALEYKLLRSAVVLSWIGALSVLYVYVHKNELKDFNIEAKRRNSKWKDAKSIDDLTLMKEYDFLQIICHISLIGRNVKQELEQCLKLRNSCGHPNSLKIGENKVSSHIETLIQNVYSEFQI